MPVSGYEERAMPVAWWIEHRRQDPGRKGTQQARDADAPSPGKAGEGGTGPNYRKSVADYREMIKGVEKDRGFSGKVE